MKKILLAIAMVSSVITNAQVTDTGDNVGIGTSNPSQKLHVIGNTRTNNLQLNGGSINASIPNTTGGWARGILYYNPNTYSTNEIGGIGMLGSGSTQTRMFMGFGDDPWYSTKGIQIATNGYIGIGTFSPNSILDINSGTLDLNARGAIIRSDINTNNSVYTQTLGLWGTSTNGDASIGFGQNSFAIIRGNYMGTSANGKLEFLTRNATSPPAVRMSILNNGFVGIGTTAPSEKLDVNGNIASTGTISLGKVASITSLRDVISLYGDRLGATNMYGFGVESDGTLYNKTTNHYRWYLNANADLGTSAKMELDDTRLFVDGNIGIGVTAPAEKLEVKGTVKADALTVIAVDYNTRITSNQIQFSRDGFSYIDNKKENGSIAIRTGGTDNIDMIVNSIGNVGIGTTNIPSQFKLAVAGKMITEEVTVKLQSTWPDYVFSNEYKLPTLQEVEKQIKEKGHLANIPSAKEVSENGIELGEMNKKLLEKVEELTLYTIQQEKAIEKQNGKILKQEKELKELKALVQKLINTNKNK